ncbi:Hol1p [Sugiyamaella lignohabitans]|uniref:Hol1p n=1 Tax=Sugiyamaella lignohabitans TaxID=796027 RepID=A0A167D2K2_9ASCO|nr:Hol1p [Sugiyamaella lignohabitans]ANB12399.1 Hol1p [Sugiyamaella lignohabitans]
MAFGILEPNDYQGPVTGTVIMMTDSGHNRRRSSATETVDEPSVSETPSSIQSAVLDGDHDVDLEKSTHHDDGLKRTANGIVLNPQPHNDPNDPLNWPIWKRDIALGVIGFQSFIIGGMSPLLAAAFTIMSIEFDVPQTTLAYLVGAYMLAMGVGSVFFAPTAVLYGKRLVYIVALVVFLVGCLVGGASNSFRMLLGARIIMGIGGSPTESLPSASIAEIYFLHERAYRLGIYTLLMLGGKNLIPMVSGFVVGTVGWHWIFWILSMIAGMNLLLTFFFVPETWWDRTPIPNKQSIKETKLAREARANSLRSRASSLGHVNEQELPMSTPDALRIRTQMSRNPSYANPITSHTTPTRRSSRVFHKDGDIATPNNTDPSEHSTATTSAVEPTVSATTKAANTSASTTGTSSNHIRDPDSPSPEQRQGQLHTKFQIDDNLTHHDREGNTSGANDYFSNFSSTHNYNSNEVPTTPQNPRTHTVRKPTFADTVEIAPSPPSADALSRPSLPRGISASSALNPRKPFMKELALINGRFTNDKWWMVALRPFFLYAYPGILFSTFIYSFSVVWLIVISETISKIFSASPYNFPITPVGLLYIATFLGGCMGSAVAGKASDLIVRTLSKRNHGVYEPEFRILMIGPVLIAVTIGMMGFGWSSFDKDLWIVPAIFLFVIGFGCSLGSTTAITYAVDSYKMFAAEALVTFNLTKNVLGFIFSLFVPKFLETSGARTTFVVFGSVQIFVCLFGIPIYIFGKRMRHWTDRVDMIRSLYVLDDDEPANHHDPTD